VDFFINLFDTSDFPRRWDCGSWTPAQGWLHIVSDLGGWGAYLAIPCVIGFFLARKKDLPFRTVFWLFGAFILFCGTTHLMEAVIFWWPAYRLAGLIKLFTALISWATVIALVPVVPQALALRSSRELEQEIADRNRAEESLRESEGRFRGTFENAAVGISHVDAKGRFLRVNQKLCDIVGYTREELLVRGFQDITHPEDLAASLDHYHSLMRGELPNFSLEKRYVRKDGSVVWGNVSLSIQNRIAGEPAYGVAILQDISELKTVEQKLRGASERLELAVRSSNLALGELDLTAGPNGRTEWLNYWEQWGTGNPENYPTAGSMLSLLHPEDRDEVARDTAEFLSGEVEEFKSVHRVQHRDGSYHWALARGVLFRDAQGRPIRSSGSVIDINDLKRAEEALRESERRFRMFVDHTSDAFFLLDENRVILDVNRQACRSLGYARGELVGMTPTDLDKGVTPADIEVLRTRLDAGEAIAFESRHCHKDGTVFPVEVRVQAFREAGCQFAVALARDISDRKRAEEALRASEERFRGTFEHSAVGIAHIDAESRCLRANQ